MSNTLAQTAIRLDLPRAATLVAPVVERRGRRWGPPSEGESEATASAGAEPAGSSSPLGEGEISRRETETRSQPATAVPSEAASDPKAPPRGRAYAPPNPSELPEVEKPPPLAEQPGRRAEKADRPHGTATPQATQEKPSAPLSPQIEENAEPAAPVPRRTQQVVAAPNVRFAGFLDAAAEHTASGQPKTANEHGAAVEKLEARPLLLEFQRASMASDSPAQRELSMGPIPAGPATPLSAGAGSPGQAATEALTTPVRILSKPRPRYPSQAVEQHLEGDVLIDVEFRYSGVLEVRGVRQGLGSRLNESALEAARKIRFLPARRDGRPVDTQATVCIRFQLAP